jgi:hypothetical protein
MKTGNRQLMWHGMFLFLLGLLTVWSNSDSLTCAWDSRDTWRE